MKIESPDYHPLPPFLLTGGTFIQKRFLNLNMRIFVLFFSPLGWRDKGVKEVCLIRFSGPSVPPS